nr:PKD domain-containing protein [Conexibacter arvalis]
MPYGIAVAPNQGPRAELVATAAPAGAATALDAGGSSDPDGVVARYAWEFGDGTARTTASPQVTHAYAAPGRYTATVTVTDDEGCSTEAVYTGQTVSCNGGDGARARVEVVVPAVPEEPGGPVPPARPRPALR